MGILGMGENLTAHDNFERGVMDYVLDMNRLLPDAAGKHLRTTDRRQALFDGLPKECRHSIEQEWQLERGPRVGSDWKAPIACLLSTRG